MTTPTPPSYSVSSLAVYLACPWQYYIQFIRKIPPPRSQARAQGTSIHKLIADHLRGPRLFPPEPGEEVRELYENFLKSRFNRPPVLCESPFLLHLEAGHVRGRIDTAFARDGASMEIVDYKSGTLRASEDLLNDIQLPLYAMAVAERFELPSEALAWTYFFLRGPEEITFAADPETFRKVTERVNRVMRSIEASDFPSTAGCTCWACKRWPPRSGSGTVS